MILARYSFRILGSPSAHDSGAYFAEEMIGFRGDEFNSHCNNDKTQRERYLNQTQLK